MCPWNIVGVQQIFAECTQRMRVCTVQLGGLLQASSHHSIIPNHVSLPAQVPVLTSPKLLSPMLVALHWILSPPPSLMFHLASFSLGVTSGLWLCLTPGWDHIVAASWPWPSCPPSLPLSCQPPLHLPKHSITLPTNVLPLGCLSYSYLYILQGQIQMPHPSSRRPDPPSRSQCHAPET